MSFLQDDVMDDVLDQIFGGGAGAGYPITYYIALFTTAPVPAGTGGVECSYTDYARFAVTNDATEFPAAALSVKSNANMWDFGVAGSAELSGDVVAVGFYDDPTDTSAASLWVVVDTGTALTINNGADVFVPASGLDLTNCLGS